MKVIRDPRLAETVLKYKPCLAVMKSLKCHFISDIEGNTVASCLCSGRRSEDRSPASNPVMHPAVTVCVPYDDSWYSWFVLQDGVYIWIYVTDIPRASDHVASRRGIV